MESIRHLGHRQAIELLPSSSMDKAISKENKIQIIELVIHVSQVGGNLSHERCTGQRNSAVTI